MSNHHDSPLADSDSANSASAQPLAGQTILVTRPADQADSMGQALAKLGANVLIQPAIEIRPPADWQPVDSAIGRLSEFDWVVFVSRNGVNYFLDRCQQLGVDFADSAQRLQLSVAAGGAKTASVLQARGVHVDLIPNSFDSEAMAAALLAVADEATTNKKDVDKKIADKKIADKVNTQDATIGKQDSGAIKFLIVRANRGSPVIAEALANANILCEQIAVYENSDVTTADPTITLKMQTGEVDWVTVTSSAIARSLVNLFGKTLQKSKLVSISPTTSEVLRELGYPPSAEASEFDMPGVVKAMMESDITGKFTLDN